MKNNIKKLSDFLRIVESAIDIDNITNDDKINDFNKVYDKFKSLSDFVKSFEPHELANAIKYSGITNILNRSNGLIEFNFKDIVLGSDMVFDIESIYYETNKDIDKGKPFEFFLVENVENMALYKFLKFLMVLRADKKSKDNVISKEKNFITKPIRSESEYVKFNIETEARIKKSLDNLKLFVNDFIKTITYIPYNNELFLTILQRYKYNKPTANITNIINYVYFFLYENVAKNVYSELIKSKKPKNILTIDVDKTIANLKSKGYLANYKKSSPKSYLKDDTDEFIYINGVDNTKFDEKANIIWMYLVKNYSKNYIDLYGVDVYRTSYDRYRSELADMFDTHNDTIKSCFVFK